MAPEAAAEAGADVLMAQSLDTKLAAAIERVAPHHTSNSVVAQTFDRVKRAGSALVQGRQIQAAVSAVNPETVLTQVELSQAEALIS